MNYDIFISYEISDSSSVYELAAVLNRNNVTYYLDCVNSSVAMSGYVKDVLEGCQVFVSFVNAKYLNEGYARNQFFCALGKDKPLLACIQVMVRW